MDEILSEFDKACKDKTITNFLLLACLKDKIDFDKVQINDLKRKKIK
jgi:hypothetical protein